MTPAEQVADATLIAERDAARAEAEQIRAELNRVRAEHAGQMFAAGQAAGDVLKHRVAAIAALTAERDRLAGQVQRLLGEEARKALTEANLTGSYSEGGFTPWTPAQAADLALTMLRLVANPDGGHRAALDGGAA